MGNEVISSQLTARATLAMQPNTVFVMLAS